MKKNIILLSSGILIFISGMLTTPSMLYLVGSNTYNLQFGETRIENNAGIPIHYPTKYTLGYSVAPGIVPDSDPDYKQVQTTLPQGRTLTLLTPQKSAITDYSSIFAGEYISIELNDAAYAESLSTPSNFSPTLDMSHEYETQSKGTYTIRTQLLYPAGEMLFNGVTPCPLAVYVMDINNADNFTIARLRYHQNTCRPSLQETWNAITLNIASEISQD